MSNATAPTPRFPARVARLMCLLALGVVAVSAGCVNTFWRTDPRPISRAELASDDGTMIKSPIKVHMMDGSTVIFSTGASVSRSAIVGPGVAYALLDTLHVPRTFIPMDSVVGVEAFDGKVLGAKSAAVSIAATAVGAVASIILLKAIFGSCPTVYADTGTGLVLEAEGFSYAIAPLLEHRDLDPLRVRAGSDGVVRLELRNEALETHFLNHIELVAVTHAAGVQVIPDQNGNPVSVGDLRRVRSAVDRSGRDVRKVLVDADGQLFSTAPSTLRSARADDLDDWIDIDVADLTAGDSMAVVLRLRNSLLNTVLLYEGVLGGHDAFDWMTDGLQHIGYALEVSRWYTRTMGMRATVQNVPVAAGGASYAGHARLSDVGPIAFRDVAIVLPRPKPDASTTSIRLRFVADNWRIDQIRVGSHISRPAVRTVPVSRVVVMTPAHGDGPVDDSAAVRMLADVDNNYLQTNPGQRMRLEFAAGKTDSTTTLLLAWHGWYREWIRGSWLASPTRTTPFVPGDAAVMTAIDRWRAGKDTLERAFYASRIPVR